MRALPRVALRRHPLTVALAMACTPIEKGGTSESDTAALGSDDIDGDGYSIDDGDCDGDSALNPGASEIRDGTRERVLPEDTEMSDMLRHELRREARKERDRMAKEGAGEPGGEAL